MVRYQCKALWDTCICSNSLRFEQDPGGTGRGTTHSAINTVTPEQAREHESLGGASRETRPMIIHTARPTTAKLEVALPRRHHFVSLVTPRLLLHHRHNHQPSFVPVGCLTRHPSLPSLPSLPWSLRCCFSWLATCHPSLTTPPAHPAIGRYTSWAGHASVGLTSEALPQRGCSITMDMLKVIKRTLSAAMASHRAQLCLQYLGHTAMTKQSLPRLPSPTCSKRREPPTKV